MAKREFTCIIMSYFCFLILVRTAPAWQVRLDRYRVEGEIR